MPKLVTEVERHQKRRAILDAAAGEIARYGYDRANINTIGSLIDDSVRTCLASDLPWQDRLSALSEAFVALAEEHRDFFRVHVSALHGVNRDIGAPMARWLATSTQTLATLLWRGMMPSSSTG